MTRNCSCGKPTRDSQYVCDACLSDLTTALAAVPWTVTELDVTLAGERGVDYAAMGGSRGAETPLPLHAGAFEAASVLRHTLVTWVRFCTEEAIRHQCANNDGPDDTLPSMALWLQWRVDGLGLNDLGGDAVSEITRAVGRARMVIDLAPEKRYAGPCECGRDLYAKPGAESVTCRACEKSYDVAELYLWMRDGVSGRMVTAFEGATLLGRFALPTAQKTIDKWHERKLLEGRGHNAEGRRLYLIDDLLSLAARNGAKTA